MTGLDELGFWLRFVVLLSEKSQFQSPAHPQLFSPSYVNVWTCRGTGARLSPNSIPTKGNNHEKPPLVSLLSQNRHWAAPNHFPHVARAPSRRNDFRLSGGLSRDVSPLCRPPVD